MRNYEDNRNFGEVKKYPATCSDCGKQCEVPFQPKEGREVRCQDCFKKWREANPRPRRF